MRDPRLQIRFSVIALNTICAILVLIAALAFLFDFNLTLWCMGAATVVALLSIIINYAGLKRFSKSNATVEIIGNGKPKVWPYMLMFSMLVLASLFFITDLFKTKTQIACLIGFFTVAAGAIIYSHRERLRFSSQRIVLAVIFLTILEIYWVIALSGINE